MSAVRYPMRAVSQRTGLSPHVLRVWERRYGAVSPARSESNRRLYAEDEIHRLSLLAKLSESGHGIRHIANLPTNKLATMVSELERSLVGSPLGTQDESLLEEAWSCIVDMNTRALQSTLDRAVVKLGLSPFVHDLIVPLIGRIGESWETGSLSPAEEHAASAVIKEALLTTSRPFAASLEAPNLLVGTPQGQLHELGAVLVVALARRDGWNVTYLGPSLPACELARAALSNSSQAIALSIVYPGDDKSLPDELRALRDALPDERPILVGGRMATAYQDALTEIGATTLANLGDLSNILQSLRAAG